MDMYRELQNLIDDRKFFLIFLVVGFLGLVVTIWLMHSFTSLPFAVSHLIAVAFWFSLASFVGSAFNLIRNEGRIEKLRRKIRTWEWQNGQAS